MEVVLEAILRDDLEARGTYPSGRLVRPSILLALGLDGRGGDKNRP